MPVRQQIAPTSPKSTSSSENSNKNIINGFQLKPFGTGAKRTTLVENDSLSSYSLPDEISNKGRRQTGEKAAFGATQDLGENVAKNVGPDKCNDTKENQGKEVFICIDSSKGIGSHQGLTYIQAYMKFMYWTCVCPFDPMRNEEPGAKITVFEWMLIFLQKTCFWIIMSLSIILSFLEVKYFLLDNFSDGNLESFINMSYFILHLASKTYYVYFLVRQQWKLLKMFKSWDKLHAFKVLSLSQNEKSNSSMWYTVVLGTVSIVVFIINIIWDVGIMGWTPEKTFQYHFEEITEDIFVWTLKEFDNGTIVENFVKQNGNGLTATKIFLGGLRMIVVFCSYLHNDALTNIMLTNAETINREMKILEAKISDLENDTENISLGEFLKENGDWAHFKLLKQAINDDNDAFDSVLKYKHANNLMLFVYFVLNAFDGEFSLTHAIHLLYNIIRASYTYRIATQASSLNDAKRKWIHRLAWKSEDKAFLDKVPLILDELDKEPIGMGKGQFLIDESFVYRFIGSVGSVFVLQAQSREAKAE